MTAMSDRPRVSAIIFDMDGTLTVPVLDFGAIRAEIGVEPGDDLLRQIEAMSPAYQRRAHAVIERHEADAARRAALNPGADRLLADLIADRVPIALLTRNSRASVDAFCDRFAVRFDAVHTREDGVTKPSPQPVLHLCREMNVAPADTLVVGDFLFDILSGKAAGSPTCLIVHGPPPEWAGEADIIIEHLSQLPERVEVQSGRGKRV